MVMHKSPVDQSFTASKENPTEFDLNPSDLPASEALSSFSSELKLDVEIPEANANSQANADSQANTDSQAMEAQHPATPVRKYRGRVVQDSAPVISTPDSVSKPALRYRGIVLQPTQVEQSKTSTIQRLIRLDFSGLSLRTKAIAVAIALGTIPTMGVGGIAYTLASTTVTQQITSEHQQKAVDAVDKLTRFVFERYGDIQVLANLPIFRDPTLRASVSLQEKQKVLLQYAETYQVYDSIAVYGLDGNLIVNGGREKAPANNSDREYFQIALKTGKPYISEPIISKVTKTANIFFAAPIKDTVTGKTIAVIRTRMPVKDLEKVIENFGDVKTNRNYHFFDKSGTIFMANEKDVVGKNIDQEFSNQLAARRLAGKPDSWIGRDASLGSTETLNAFTATQAFQGMPDLKFGLVYNINTANGFKAVNDLRLSILLGTTVAAVLIGFLGTILADRATRPIQTAAKTVEKIGRGELDARIDVVGEDEFATLGNNINQMAMALESLIEEQKAETERIELARQEARMDADASAQEQRQAKEFLQKRALELLIEVDPVSRGDLTVRANVTPDEIGTVADSYNAIIRSLRQIVQKVQGAAASVTDTAQDNASTVKKVAEEATEQALAIANALVQLQVVTQTSEGVAEFAKQAEQQVKLANTAVEDGDAAMNRTVAGISTIRETVSQTSKKVKRLGEASQKISKVVNLISGFAAQTNMLALNAAIEAARAGEEGRGFSVVAEEVRALAQQSAAATAEIESLVEEIQTQTNEVVTAMESGTEQVVVGTQLVEESRQKLTQISAVSTQVNQLIQEIAQAAVKQTQASATVSQTMQDVATIATDTSKQSEDMAGSFGRLLEVAQGLQVSVAQFKVS
ncbi:MAG: methyl-accepting chemotaxis protein [Thermosynechococcaceae cyanobacterium MS004]|nr:methyl-accepting chemotaxis protein [Thermosynechococcaceae cyanobacterium MS004]